MKLLFAGYGRIARRHRAALAPLRDRFTLGVACADPARAAALRASGAFAFAAKSYAEGIDDPAVGAVFVALPPHLHYDLALHAIEAGKHVVLEKPATTTADQFAALMERAEQRGVGLYITENHAFMPMHRRICALVADGAIGEVREVRLVRRGVVAPDGSWRFDPAISPGALYEGGVHWVRRLRELAAPMQADCTALASTRHDWSNPVELASTSRFAFAGGAQGVLDHSWLHAKSTPLGDWSTVTGTRGTIAFLGNGLLGWQRGGSGAGVLLPGLHDRQGFGALWQAIADDIAGRARFPLPNAVILSDLRLIEACYRLQAAQRPGGIAREGAS